MGSAYDKREQRKHAEGEQSARAVAGMLKAKAELLRDSAPNVVLALVAGAALAPIAATAAAVGGVPNAVLQAVGGVGTNVVSELLMRRLDRWREQEGPPEPAAMADAISGDILAVLRRDDVVAAELARQLVSEVEALGGFEAALGAASGELRGYLDVCFGELKAGQRQVLGAVHDVRDEQRRQRAGIEEAVDRLRMLSRPQPNGTARRRCILARSSSRSPPSGTLRRRRERPRRTRAGALARKSWSATGCICSMATCSRSGPIPVSRPYCGRRRPGS